MKKLIYLTVICFITITASAFETNKVPNEIRREINIDHFSKSRVILETGFGSSIFIQDDAYQELIDKDIMKVSLIYTTYREVNDFDQIDLNEKRWKNLFNLMPNLEDNAKVKFIEIGMDKCKIQRCAEDQLHGFIVEYKKETFNYTNLEIQSNKIQCDEVNEIIGDQGTKIKIPANAFVDINGKDVTGEVEIQLREALSTEDIVIAKLLTITNDYLPLESGGMVEVTAISNGRQLKLKEDKLISISIPKKKNVPDMKVWEGEWKNGQLQWTKPQQLIEGEAKSLTVDVKKPMAVEREMISTQIQLVADIAINDTLPSVSISLGEQPKSDHVQVSSVRFSTTNDILEAVYITTPGIILDFSLEDYTFEKGKELGLSDYQATKIMRWFENEEIPSNIPFQFWGWSRVTTNDWNVPVLSNGRRSRSTQARVNMGYVNSSAAYVFSARKLGWSNIDRLAKLRHSKSAKLEIACVNISKVDDVSASMIIPRRNIYLPGYKMKNGNYSFIPEGLEQNYKLPIGEKAVVIMTGAKGDQEFSAIKKVVLGENKIEEAKLTPKTKSEIVNELKKMI